MWNWHRNSDTEIDFRSGRSCGHCQPVRETADSLAALREAKQRGIRTLGIVNVVGSSIAREADNVFTLWRDRKFL